MINLKEVSAKYGLPVKVLNLIYEEYLRLIRDKAKEAFAKLDKADMQSMEDIHYNRGDYCFYLRYLGKYYVNYKAYMKWKSKRLKS